MKLLKGQVKWFHAARGFGFITAEDGRDYFIHYKNLLVDGFRTIEEGARVEFLPVDNLKGLEAQRVTVCS